MLVGVGKIYLKLLNGKMIFWQSDQVGRGVTENLVRFCSVGKQIHVKVPKNAAWRYILNSDKKSPYHLLSWKRYKTGSFWKTKQQQNLEKHLFVLELRGVHLPNFPLYWGLENEFSQTGSEHHYILVNALLLTCHL